MTLNFPSMQGNKTEKSESHEDRMARLVEAQSKVQKTKGGTPLMDFPSMRTESALASQAIKGASEQKLKDARDQHQREQAYIKEHGPIDRVHWNPETMKHEYPGQGEE